MSDESQGGEPIQKEKDAHSEHGETDPEEAPNPNPSPVSSSIGSQINPRPPKDETSQKHKNKGCKKLHFHFKKRKDTYECFGVLAAVIIAVAAIWQIKVMQQDRNLDERAWIGVQDAGLILPYIAEHIGLHVTLINTGKTPAKIEDIDVSVGTIYGDSTNVNIIIEKHLDGYEASPGQSYPILINQSLPGGKKDFAMLIEKKMKVCFFLKIRYLDMFNEIRHTDVGFIVTGHQDDVRGDGSIIHVIPDFGRMD